VAGAALVAGTTRRRGRRRKYFSLFPEQLAERVQSSRGGEVAVVFGNEDAGLSDRELAACHLAVTIPSSSAFPSLNLSHAVQLVCYEIYRALTRGPSSAVPPGGPSNETEAGIRRTLTPFSPISVREIEALVSVITRSLQAIGFFTIVGPDSMAVFWKDIIARAGLSVGEARRLGVVFRKIGGLVTGRGIDPKPLPP
jgi:tRNA/rRNA methyltransferase